MDTKNNHYMKGFTPYAIAAAVLLLLLLRLPRVADRAERLRLSLPFFGELRREVLWLQVLRALSMLVSCGISIDEAAREAASVTGSRYMRQRLLAVFPRHRGNQRRAGAVLCLQCQHGES